MKISCYHKSASFCIRVCFQKCFHQSVMRFYFPVVLLPSQWSVCPNALPSLNETFLHNRSPVSWEREDFLKPSVCDALLVPQESWDPCVWPVYQCLLMGTLHRAAQRCKILSRGSQMYSQSNKDRMLNEGIFEMQVWVSYDNENIINKVHLRRVISTQLLVQQQDISSFPWLAAAMWFITYPGTSSSHSCRDCHRVWPWCPHSAPPFLSSPLACIVWGVPQRFRALHSATAFPPRIPLLL